MAPILGAPRGLDPYAMSGDAELEYKKMTKTKALALTPARSPRRPETIICILAGTREGKPAQTRRKARLGSRRWWGCGFPRDGGRRAKTGGGAPSAGSRTFLQRAELRLSQVGGRPRRPHVATRNKASPKSLPKGETNPQGEKIYRADPELPTFPTVWRNHEGMRNGWAANKTTSVAWPWLALC